MVFNKDHRPTFAWTRSLWPLLLALLITAGLFGILRAYGLGTQLSPQSGCPTGTLLVPQYFTITVDLQRPNASPPDPSWAVPVHLTLHPPLGQEVCHEWELQLDEHGRWEGNLDAFTGLYDARIKNIHTLQNVRRDVQISATNKIDMGTLREGDANDDNRVQLLDFGILRNAYGTSQGDSGFDPRTDFDENDQINLRDFGLLRRNYGDQGDIEVTSAALSDAPVVRTSTDRGVTISVQPPTTTLALDDHGAVTITVQASTEEVVGAEFDLHFDPGFLQPIDADPDEDGLQIEPAGPLTEILINRVDLLTHTARVRYGAGTFGAPLTGTFPLAVFHIRAIAPTSATPLAFETADAVDSLGTSILDRSRGGVVTVPSAAHACYLPLVARAR